MPFCLKHLIPAIPRGQICSEHSDSEGEGENKPFTPTSSYGWSSTLTSIYSDSGADQLFICPSPNYNGAFPFGGVDKPFITPFSNCNEILGHTA